MPKSKQAPYVSYGIDDWKWEFLRRNKHYKRAYRAIDWLQQRFPNGFKGFGLLDHVHALNLSNRLKDRCGLGLPKLKEELKGQSSFLPSPSVPAHGYQNSPVSASNIVTVYESTVFKSEPSELYPEENQVVAVIDTRHSMEEIVKDLKVQVRPFLSKQRSQLDKYKDYLAVWDLREKGWIDSQIAQKVWPKELNRVGGRIEQDKWPLIQRVYDDSKAAQKLIDQSFPLKIKK